MGMSEFNKRRARKVFKPIPPVEICILPHGLLKFVGGVVDHVRFFLAASGYGHIQPVVVRNIQLPIPG